MCEQSDECRSFASETLSPRRRSIERHTANAILIAARQLPFDVQAHRDEASCISSYFSSHQEKTWFRHGRLSSVAASMRTSDCIARMLAATWKDRSRTIEMIEI